MSNAVINEILIYLINHHAISYDLQINQLITLEIDRKISTYEYFIVFSNQNAIKSTIQYNYPNIHEFSSSKISQITK